MGVFVAMVIQSIGSPNERTSLEVAQGEFQQSSMKSGDGNLKKSNIEIGQFQEIFKHRSFTEQRKALYTILARATEQELKDWWTESQKIERLSHREIAQQVVLRNLTAINPQEALRCLDDVSIFRIDALLKTVFAEWALSQLEGAIEAATTLSSPRRNIALQAILKIRDDLSDSQRHSIAMQLESEETFLKLVSYSNASKRLAEPAESWGILINDDVDDFLQTESLAIVAEALLAQAGMGVLTKIYSDVEEYRVRTSW